ncbi:MAG TPA: hypothetical protein VF006_04215 [Longimicrobium sp.]
MPGRNGARMRSARRRGSATVLVGLMAGLAACDGGAPLDPARALPPTEASRLVNPLCTGTGGQTHAAATINTAVTWAASGNPHTVTGMITLGSGGTLTLPPGVIVCFSAQTGLQSSGGRLVAQGSAAAPVVLTAFNPVDGWYGVSLQGTPPGTSYLTNARVEYATLYSTAVAAFGHPLVIDSTIVRQSGGGVRLEGRASTFIRSRVDTTTNRYIAAVTLGDSGRFEQSVILRSAGVGLLIQGTAGIRATGGRIEASGGIGIRAVHTTGIVGSGLPPVRVVGGASYPIETTAALLRRLYDSPDGAYQDSLKGNARDTVIMLGGPLSANIYVRPGLPWHVKAPIEVQGSALRARAASLLVLDPGVGITVSGSGRIDLRGTASSPVVLTADDPARGWAGIVFDSIPPAASRIVSTRLEHVGYEYTAVESRNAHPVVVDSTVIRQSGRAISLLAAGSRVSRTRVDTTLSSLGPAVELGANVILESTRIRGSSREGVAIRASTVQVLSCEVLGSVTDGIVMDVATPVHDCNLVGNLGVGIRNLQPASTPAAYANATGNWWGDAGGPTAPAGDGVAGAVTYSPWLTSPFVLPYVP